MCIRDRLQPALRLVAGQVCRLRLQTQLPGIVGNRPAEPQNLIIRMRHNEQQISLFAGRLPSMRQRKIRRALGKQIHLPNGRLALTPIRAGKRNAESPALRREGPIRLEMCIRDRENTKAILEQEVGAVFARVLEDAGVYKRTDAGRAAFLRFAAAIGNTL